MERGAVGGGRRRLALPPHPDKTCAVHCFTGALLLPFLPAALVLVQPPDDGPAHVLLLGCLSFSVRHLVRADAFVFER